MNGRARLGTFWAEAASGLVGMTVCAGGLPVTGVGIEPTTYGLKVRCSTD